MPYSELTVELPLSLYVAFTVFVGLIVIAAIVLSLANKPYAGIYLILFTLIATLILGALTDTLGYIRRDEVIEKIETNWGIVVDHSVENGRRILKEDFPYTKNGELHTGRIIEDSEGFAQLFNVETGVKEPSISESKE